MSQMELDLDASQRAMERGIAAAVDDTFIERGIAVVVERLRGQEVLAEQFRAACEAAGVTPHRPQCWGALTRHLMRRGLISWTGQLGPSKSVRSHARRQPVWRVAG